MAKVDAVFIISAKVLPRMLAETVRCIQAELDDMKWLISNGHLQVFRRKHLKIINISKTTAAQKKSFIRFGNHLIKLNGELWMDLNFALASLVELVWRVARWLLCKISMLNSNKVENKVKRLVPWFTLNFFSAKVHRKSNNRRISQRDFSVNRTNP